MICGQMTYIKSNYDSVLLFYSIIHLVMAAQNSTNAVQFDDCHKNVILVFNSTKRSFVVFPFEVS